MFVLCHSANSVEIVQVALLARADQLVSHLGGNHHSKSASQLLSVPIYISGLPQNTEREKHHISSSHLGLTRCLNPVRVSATIHTQTFCLRLRVVDREWQLVEAVDKQQQRGHSQIARMATEGNGDPHRSFLRLPAHSRAPVTVSHTQIDL